MLVIKLEETECFDNGVAQSFYTAPAVTLFLEHSLIAISKWEAKYKIPFLKSVEYLAQPKHVDKFYFYINCMSTKGDISQTDIKRLEAEHIKQISDYITDIHSATIAQPSSGGKKNQIITSERLYALMAGYRIPHEYSRWHLNNLLMVINICAEMQEDPKKRKKADPATTMAYYEQNEKLRKEGMTL